MCGILGIARVGGAPPAALDAIELLRHRGPDSGRSLVDGPVAIAIRRLAIIDVPGGDQPLSNETGDVTVVCNGEIYNFVELREELRSRGHRFATGSDVEVVVHLYEEEGDGCFRAAAGDVRAGALGRAAPPARAGARPVRHQAALPRGRRRRDRLRVRDRTAAGARCSGGDRSGNRRRRLPRLRLGERPVCRRAARSRRALARLARRRTLAQRRSPGSCLALDSLEAPLTEEAVRIHLRSDVPLAVFLSGGLDSSLIAALAAAELEQQLHTFTASFDDAAFDEAEPARIVARAIGSDHHEVSVKTDVARDLPEIVRRLDEPNADPSAIPLWYLCRAAAGEVKVALAGEGGDEVFGGYARYAWDRRARALGRVPPGSGGGRDARAHPERGARHRGGARKRRSPQRSSSCAARARLPGALLLLVRARLGDVRGGARREARPVRARVSPGSSTAPPTGARRAWATPVGRPADDAPQGSAREGGPDVDDPLARAARAAPRLADRCRRARASRPREGRGSEDQAHPAAARRPAAPGADRAAAQAGLRGADRPLAARRAGAARAGAPVGGRRRPARRRRRPRCAAIAQGASRR